MKELRTAPPASARILNQWVDSFARREGQSPARVRNWVSYMILGGALLRSGFSERGPRFTIKGGVAVELRLRGLARATKDLDLVANSGDDLVVELEDAVREPYEGFTFRLKGEPNLMPNGAARLQVALSYRGKGWDTVTVDVAHPERGSTNVEMVDAIPLAQFGLSGPDSLPCLSLPYHVAQKVHAMTQPPPEGRRNERFKDLADLLLLAPHLTDLIGVKKACEEVFVERNTHEWPPYLDPPDHWGKPFAEMASSVGLKTTDLYDAAAKLRSWIRGIEPSAPWAGPAELGADASLVTWYYAIGPDERVVRVPARLGDAVFGRDETADLSDVRDEWQRDPGGLALVGVVVAIQDRRPVYVERADTLSVALRDDALGKNVAYGESVWLSLAEALLARAGAPRRAIDSFAVYLSNRHGMLPVQLGSRLRVGSRQAHQYFLNTHIVSPDAVILWDLWRSRVASTAGRVEHAVTT